ncbi:hypothetical protein [Aneurinibacillus terranovensis]|nr:hypothetical protein [Aneurinibacillus terranovensis]
MTFITSKLKDLNQYTKVEEPLEKSRRKSKDHTVSQELCYLMN